MKIINTRNIVFIFVICLTYCATARAEVDENLLKNPSFESGMNTDVLDSWKGEGDGAFREMTSSYGYTLDEYTYPDGEFALKVFGGGANLYQENLRIQADRDYYVSGQFYHSTGQDVISASTNSLRAFFHIEWFDEYHHLLREDFSPNHSGGDTADRWVGIDTVFRSPVNAVYATFHIQTDIDEGGGSIFIDAVEFGLKK